MFSLYYKTVTKYFHHTNKFILLLLSRIKIYFNIVELT